MTTTQTNAINGAIKGMSNSELLAELAELKAEMTDDEMLAEMSEAEQEESDHYCYAMMVACKARGI